MIPLRVGQKLRHPYEKNTKSEAFTGVSIMSRNNAKYEVVITDSDFEDGSVEQDILSGVGAVVKKHQTFEAEEIKRVTKMADAIITELASVSRDVISNLDKTRVIVTYGIGYDNVDVNAATERGILVCNNPDFMTYEVSEHALALILSLVRRLPISDRLTREGEWSKQGSMIWVKLMPLSFMDEKKAGVVGLGRIGKQVAAFLQAFHTKVMAFDPYISEETANKLGIEMVDLHTLMKESDIISVNTLLTNETFHLIGPKEISLMKRTAIIVNTSRGKIIDQNALVEALTSKKIAAAGLDVFEKEPLDANDPLLNMDNVILTPHVAGYSEKSINAWRILAAEEVARVLGGHQPKHPINSEALSKRQS